MRSRIQNMEMLFSAGNLPGRKAMLQILETGLRASDPYPERAQTHPAARIAGGDSGRAAR